MGLSTHELWLVLRARDEATRVLRNVMAGMQKEHTNVINSQIDEVRGLMAASNDSYNAQREQIVKTIKTAQALNHESQTRISEIGRERDAALRAIGDERDDIRLVINDKQDEIRESRYRISELGRERDAAISALNDESDSLVKASKLRSLLNDDAIADIDRRVIETASAHKAELSQLSGLVAAKQREITITDRQIKKIGLRTQSAVDGLKREKLSIQELGSAADEASLQRLSQIGREITSTQLLSREKIRALNKDREAQLKNLDLAKANLDFAEKGNKAELDALNARRDELIKVGKVDVEQTKLSVEALKTRERAIRNTSKLEIQSINEGIDAKRKDIDFAQSRIRLLGEVGTAARNSAKVEIDELNKVIETRRADIDASRAQIETIKAVQKTSNATYQKRIADLQDEMDKADEAYAKHQRTIGQLQHIGAGFVTAGVGAGIFGVAVEAGLYTAAKGFIEYQQMAAKSFTQVDNHGETSMQHVIDMGYRVAKEIPVAFEQIQPAIYDIFSSMEITTTEQGERILNAMSKGAVGAMTDIQTVTQTTVGIMNAYGLAAEDAIKVNDFMFQLVRKGVGDYDQFGAAIGKVIPSAQRANQSYQEIGAALAFLTRNGTNAANAGTYVARTMDAIANAKTQSNFQKVGMSVREATGEFKPMSKIMSEINDKTKDMSASAKAGFVQELFKGSGGTIQAMKAINLMLGEHSNLYKTMQADMQDAGGAAEDAYNIMKDTPAAKIQEMKNQWELVGQAVGLAALPALMSIAEAIKGVADWFNSLDPGMQTAITNFLLIGGAVSILMGLLLIVAGGIMMVVSGVMAVGVGLAATIAGVVLGIGLVIAIIIALIAFWPQISAAAQSAFNAVIGFVQGFVGAFMEKFAFFQPFFAEIGNVFKGAWDLIVKTINDVVNNPGLTEFTTNVTAMAGDIGGKLEQLGAMFQLFGGALANVFGAIGLAISTFVMLVWAILSPFITAIGSGLVAGFMALWAGIQVVFSGIVTFITGILQVLTGLFTGNWQMMFDGAMNILNGFINVVAGLLIGFVGTIMGIIGGLIGGFIAFFVNLYDVLVGHSIIPDMVNAIIQWIASLPGAIFATLAGLVTGAIAKFNEMKAQAVAIINIMVLMVLAKIVTWIRDMDAKVAALPAMLTAALGPLGTMIAKVATTAWNMFKTAVLAGIDIVLAIVRGNPAQILAALGNVGTLLLGAGNAIMKGFADGLKASWKLVTDFVGGIAAWIRNNKGPLDYDYKLLQPAGNAIMSGFGDALNSGFSTVQSSVATMGARLVTSATSNAMSQAAMFKDVGIISGQNLVSGLLSMESQVAGAAGRMNAAIAMDTALNNGSVVSNGAGLSGATVNVDVHTQEIDPVKHAADLGHEISSRLGSW